jgi:prepilin-type N-terminal cleavage/methylation domain-containing protein
MRRREAAGSGGFTLVELMVVLVLLGVVGGSITRVVIQQLQVEQNQQQLQAVIQDGRVSLQRIRSELRQVRRVHESSGPDRLHVWIDANQDATVQASEQVCYVVEPLPGGVEGQWQISRWANAVQVGTPAKDYADSDCAPGRVLPSGQTRTVVARTLTDPEPFVEYSPEPAGPLEVQTREITIRLELEVLGGRGPGAVDTEARVRLRNVP